jgi:hypothetical protein
MASRARRCAGGIALLGVLTVNLSAQVPPLPLKGNPTPGTPQPDPPNLADRITLTGCVQAVDLKGGSGPTSGGPIAPTDAHFVLTDAKRESRVPPGAGTSSAARSASSRIYRLAATDASLSPFVGSWVEISGEVDLPPADAAGGDARPTLQVAFIQRIARRCAP